jgi:hypothetical protein
MNTDKILDKIYETIDEKGKEFVVNELQKGKFRFLCPNILGLKDNFDDCNEGIEHNCKKCWNDAL